MPKKLLLIEYDARSLERLRSLLSAEYEVIEARDGEEGLQVFSSARFDLVLLSGMLPRLPSAEVIREIRRRGGPMAPPIILMVAGYRGTNTKADAQKVGAFEILIRPFSDQELRAAVAAAADFTDPGRTARIPTSELRKASALTSSDIFAEVLKEVGAEPAVPSASRPAARTEDEVERRLRDTLSGVLGERTPARGVRPEPQSRPQPRPAPPPAAPRPPSSADAEIEKLLSQTLSMKIPRPKPSASTVPVPAAAPPARLESAQGAARPEPAPVSPTGPDRFGQYEILEKIDAGGMAETFKARRSGVEGFQKIVAIKKILPHIADDEEFITMFADEAKLAAQLNHPNIVHIFDLGKIEAGGYFIAMEYVEGRDLRAILRAGGEADIPLPAPLAVFIAAKVASALDYAHRRREQDGGRELRIVHRDVSPPNILISNEGDIKLCDFGVAKAARKVSRTEAGALKGKVPYMSPEQAWGRPLDSRSDIFSLGCVLFEMLTGQKLFRGDTELSVLEKVRAAEIPAASSLNPEIPAFLDAILARALARDPEQRYANASDLQRDLEAVLHSYVPPPSSADLADYLRRLKARPVAVGETPAVREPAPPSPERKRKTKEPPAIRLKIFPTPSPASGSVPPVEPAPVERPPEVFAAMRIEPEPKSRARLYAMIAAAAVLLAAAGYWVLSRPAAAPSRAAAVAPTVLPATPVAVAAMAPAPTAAPPAAAFDAKAIEAEVQRQLALRKKEMQAQKPEAPARKTEAPARQAAEAPIKKNEAPAAETAPAPAPTEPAPARTEPTAVVVVPTAVVVASGPPPASASRAPAPEPPEVSPGDLVGPGPGVVEPSLISSPKVTYPAIARQQRVTGKVVVLLLVDEQGTVTQAKLQQGIATRTGVNEAVVEAFRQARFRSATKNGVPVKMWRTVVVDVKP